MHRAISLAVHASPNCFLIILPTALLVKSGRRAQIFEASFCHAECLVRYRSALILPPALAPFRALQRPFQIETANSIARPVSQADQLKKQCKRPEILRG